MELQEYYYTIDRPSSAEFKDRGSRFIAYANPVENADSFKKLLQEIKKEHNKAVHHCFAYRLGVAGDHFRANDDGEPSGTAGRPILGQIDSRKLTNTAIIVVRYFGGTLLGVPGLINAYKTVSALVLQTTPVVQRQIELTYSIQFDYTQVNDVIQILKQTNSSIIEQDFRLFPIIKAGIPSGRLDEVVHRLKDLRNVELEKIL